MYLPPEAAGKSTAFPSHAEVSGGRITDSRLWVGKGDPGDDFFSFFSKSVLADIIFLQSD